ncbi:anti-sigma factor family protein [Streptomyces sp. NPDC048297]|uniref:anti-sigma factor family protein n=1 Tax=Streptomyces sp. NPDC048297 TaxID=3365531 RepID=UPI00371D23EE
MTSSTDTAGHPDAAEISDLTEGLLAPDRSADVQRHLEGCEACADLHGSLEEIRGLLGSVPAPEPMPADVVARIDAALATEARTGASADAGPAPAPAPAPATEASTETGVSRETSTPSDRPAGRPHAATGPGRKDRGRGRGHRRRTVALGAVLTAAVIGAGSLLLQSLGTGSSDTTARSTPSPSAAAFSGASVQSQAKDLLSLKRGLPKTSGRPQHGTGTEQIDPGSTQTANTLLQSEVPVPDCVRRAVDAGGDVLGAKTGTYAGKEAYLVVVPDSHDHARVTAYVIDASCTARQPVSPGTVLLKQSLARP